MLASFAGQIREELTVTFELYIVFVYVRVLINNYVITLHYTGKMSEQRVFIMRHGERLDTRDPSWKRSAPRPYDTPLTRHGHSETLRLVKQRLTDKVLTISHLLVAST